MLMKLTQDHGVLQSNFDTPLFVERIVITGTHWKPPIILDLFGKQNGSAQKEFIPNTSALNILKSASKCHEVKG